MWKMNKLSKYGIVSTLVFLLLIANISRGYEFGPVIDRIIVYFKQYEAFSQAHATANEIKSNLTNDIPYPNVPEYSLNERNVPFYLYTRKNPNVPQILYVGDSVERLSLAGFDPNHDTVLFCHGFVVTFADFASNFTTLYLQAVTVFDLGTVIARFVKTLLEAGADPKNMNFIGHSDGAAALALAAKQIHPKVGRLNVFDPVGSYFNFLPPTMRVSISDADFVQIVHCTVYTEGLPPQIKGDVTFYMNGALIQPQCANFTKVSSAAYCSHITCLSYLNESLKKNSLLLGIKCAGFLSHAPKDYDFSDKVILTYDVPSTTEGNYCVHTNSPAPPQL